MFTVTRAPIDAAALEESVRADGYGAVVTFIGKVRDRSEDGRAVVALEYEAHEEMALVALERIAGDVCVLYGDVRIAVAHRIGALRVGEVTLAVAVAAPHRRQAFSACSSVVDRLKAEAPIWKKECYADGSARWRENEHVRRT